uniref:Disease resistance protein RGA2 n=1 Tax=Aegilops tauschii TaxID=37682 RepID=M8C6R9_AEGTA
MAESLLLPVVRGVAGKAADTLVQTVTRMCGLDDDRQSLERHLLAIECKLANAEERSQTNVYLKSWMEKLKAITYDTDDVIDDFQYEALRRNAQIGNSTPRTILDYVTHHSPLLFRFAMSGKLKSVLEKINNLVEEMNKFGLENSVHREEPQYRWRQTHSRLDEFTKISERDHDKDGVVKLLLDQRDQRKVQVLPIFGMGGLGKTALAKMLKIWHCVSDNVDIISLLKFIIQLAINDLPEKEKGKELATIGSWYLSGSIELLQKKLEEVMGRKRFLLVLDDVWNEEKRMWDDELKPLLCSVGGPGSVIVVTCRSKKVASIMCTVKPHELAFLSEEDSWELFWNKAFNNDVEEQVELVTIGRRIVNKCGGLPLALKTMGGLLSSKQLVPEWKAIEETNIGDNIGGKHEVMPILKLSYKHLSSEMKQCFAFCALFPKDYEMQKDMLIQLRIANGFIQEEGTMDLTQKGEFIFHELVWRSFLQDMKVIVKSMFFYDTTEHETIVKVEKIIGFFDSKSSLRTLLAPSSIHQDLKRLYVGRWLERMPRNIGQLNNLRTLTTFVVDTTDGCGIEELKDLQHLHNRLELHNLRDIKSVKHAKEANLQQKQYLSELLFSWGLTIYGEPENEGCNEEEMFQYLEPHIKIQILELYGYGGVEVPQWMRDPQMFQCLRKLTIFNLTRCKNLPVVWLSPTLEYLSLKIIDKLKTLCDNPYIEVGGHNTPLKIFPNLKKMILKGLLSLEGWIENNAGVAIDSLVTFPVLEELEIEDCPKLSSFPLSPVLKVLKINEFDIVGLRSRREGKDETPQIDSPCLVALPSNLGDLTKLWELLVHDCKSLKALPDGMDRLTSLRSLTIMNSPAIEQLPNGLLERLPTLDYLFIWGCPELELRCREGGEYFHHLLPIPHKYIATESELQFRMRAPEAESSGKNFLRRLLPCCVRSKSDSESNNNQGSADSETF